VWCQLRVVRAFRSTLEDLEEKRSVHSFNSFHSLRSSRSQHGPRTITEEASTTTTTTGVSSTGGQRFNKDRFLRTAPPRLTSSRTPSLPSPDTAASADITINVTAPPSFRIKSQSFESVLLVSKHHTPAKTQSSPVFKNCPAKTLSQTDINKVHVENANMDASTSLTSETSMKKHMS
jgi:hypothetical protein